MKLITHTPLFWIFLTITSISCIGFSYRYFSTAFPIVNLSLDMSRSDALEKSMELASQLDIGPKEFKQAASFEVDQEVQTFVELEAGGKQAFTQMLRDHYYAPYQWTVRHFKECDKHELLIKFKPDGTPYGFVETLSENVPGASLDLIQAQSIAEKKASQSPWNIIFNEYRLIEPSKEIRPSGRIDYQFTYERTNAAIGNGTYRLKLVISGDRLSELSHFVKIPEEFTLRYQEMRSANNSIAAGANMAYLLLYIFGGCILGLFFLMRRNWILWRSAIIWALIIAGLHALVNINQLPLSWMNYHTALSIHGFILKYCMAILFQFLYMSIFYGIIFIAAESLARAAFSYHPQLWHVWNPTAASSSAVAGRTIGGYLLVPLCLAFIILFYRITSSSLNWWIPSASLIDPNILATYMPWLSCVVLSLGAGFMEECLFRAIPISCAALIGKRFGNIRFWLIIGFIIQAIIFGAAHANYAAQPAYARVVELLVFSILQGLIFLWFGLLPAIITHFTYDVVLMSLPLFVSTAHGAWLNQVIVIILTLIPLFIIIRARIITGAWNHLSARWLNGSWQPMPTKEQEDIIANIQETKTFGSRFQKFIIALGLLGLILLVKNISTKQDGTDLNTNKSDAIISAQKILESQNISLSSWIALPSIADDQRDIQEQQLQSQFIWQEGGPELYHQILGNYLNPARWYIRFITWDGSVSDRAEEHIISIASDGKLYRQFHKLAENSVGESLDEMQARTIAQQGLQSIFNLNPDNLKEISAVANKHPERKDWMFTYANSAIETPAQSQLRNVIVIAGNTIVGGYSYVHVPEEWERNQLNKNNMLKIISFLCMLLLFFIVGLGAFYAIKRNKNIQLAPRSVVFFCATLCILGLIKLINSWPSTIATFNTSEPFTHQLFSFIGMGMIGILFQAGSLGIILAILTSWKKPYILSHKKPWFWGICVGIFSSGILSFIQIIQRYYEPLWADYGSMAHLIPAFSTIIEALLAFFMLSAFLMLVCIIIDMSSAYWHKRPWILGIFCIFLGLSLAGRMTPESFSFLLITGILLAIILLIVYLTIGRYSNQALIWAAATIISVYYLQEAIFNAYPYAIAGNVLAILGIFCFAYAWNRYMKQP